jgi:capsular exopolysaccharide synthesis family protein
LVTSGGPREGKSTVIVALAVTMAQAGSRVVIVDTDMRRPRMHKSFGVSNDRGISTAILGEASIGDLVIKTGIPNVDLLPCGPIPPNPAEILHTDRFKEITRQLAARYDRVLFDSPPVGAVTDPLVLSSMVDGVVFVVQAASTPWPAALQVKKRLGDVGARILGVVLNNVDLGGGRSGDYYQHYYYYRYGEDEQKGPRKAVSNV